MMGTAAVRYLDTSILCLHSREHQLHTRLHFRSPPRIHRTAHHHTEKICFVSPAMHDYPRRDYSIISAWMTWAVRMDLDLSKVRAEEAAAQSQDFFGTGTTNVHPFLDAALTLARHHITHNIASILRSPATTF